MSTGTAIAIGFAVLAIAAVGAALVYSNAQREAALKASQTKDDGAFERILSGAGKLVDDYI